MLYMTVVARSSIKHSRQCGPSQNLTYGSDSMCLAEIGKFQSPYLAVWSVLPVIPVNMD